MYDTCSQAQDIWSSMVEALTPQQLLQPSVPTLQTLLSARPFPLRACWKLAFASSPQQQQSMPVHPLVRVAEKTLPGPLGAGPKLLHALTPHPPTTNCKAYM